MNKKPKNLSGRILNKTATILVLITFLTSYTPVRAQDILPQGGVVTSGNAQLDYSTPSTLNINVGSNQAIADWNSYSIGSGNTVNYNRDSSFVFLNRVTGSDPSNIFGSLNAINGRIFLINPSGVLFAPGSSVNAAGLVASTLNIKDSDFLAGRYTFFGDGGKVVNQGYISAPGGYVALLGPTVENSGIIEANLGSVALASGKSLTLNLDPQGIISVAIDQATTTNLENKDVAVQNIGRISADGGKVTLTAKALKGVFKKAVNNEGVIEAKSLVNKNGQVYLLADMENSLVSNTGTIDVSAATQNTKGGFVEISGHDVNVAGNIHVAGNGAESGNLLIDPWDLTVVGYDPGGSFGGTILANDPPLTGESFVWANLLENFDGSITIQALNDINFNIFDATFHPTNLLNLYKITSGRTFTAQAGRNINLNNDFIITAGGGVSFTADDDFNNGGVSTEDGIGDINTGTSYGITTNNGDVILDGVNVNLQSNIKNVDAGVSGNIFINAKDKIVSFGGPITGNNLSLSAVNGIGHTGTVSTSVNNLQALNTSTGDINISNDKALGISGAGVVNNAPGAEINISSLGTLTLTSALISSLGIISLTALGTGDIILDSGVVSSHNNLHLSAAASQAANVLRAGGNIILKNASSVITTSDTSDAMSYLIAKNDISMDNNSHALVSAGQWGGNYIDAQNNFSMKDSSVEVTTSSALPSDITYTAVNAYNGGVSLDNSRISATAASTRAWNFIGTHTGTILDNNSSVIADSIGKTWNSLISDGDIIVKNASSIKALSSSIGSSLASNSLVSNNGNINMDAGTLEANSNYGNAKNSLRAYGNILLDNNTLVKTQSTNGSASDDIIADTGNIILKNLSNIITTSTSSSAISYLGAQNNDISLDNNSHVLASAGTTAANYMEAHNNLSLKGSSSIETTSLSAASGDIAYTGLYAYNGGFTLDNSRILSTANAGQATNHLESNNFGLSSSSLIRATSVLNNAQNYLGTYSGAISLDNSSILADSIGYASNSLMSYGDIIMKDASSVKALNSSIGGSSAENTLRSYNGNINVDAGTLEANSYYGNAKNSLRAYGNILLDNNGLIKTQSNNGYASGDILADYGYIKLDNGSAIKAIGYNVDSSNTLYAYLDILINNLAGIFSENYNANSANSINSTYGSIVLNNGSLSATNQNGKSNNYLFANASISLDNASGVTSTSVSNDAANRLATSNSNINVLNNSFVSSTAGNMANVAILALGNVNIANSNIQALGGSLWTSPNYIDIESYTGDINVDNSLITLSSLAAPTSLDGVYLIAKQGLELKGSSSVINNVGDIYLWALTNDVSLKDSSFVDAFGNLDMLAVRDVNFSGSGYVKAGSLAKITSYGAVNGSSLSTNDIIADTLNISAANGIGSGNAIKTKVNKLTSSNAVSLDTQIINNGTSNLEVLSLFNNGGDVHLTSDGDISITSLNAHTFGLSGGNAWVNSLNGSILGVGSGTHVNSGLDLHLNSGNTIGSWGSYFPLNINVGRDLYLAINNRSDSAIGSVGAMGVSGTLGGTVAGSYNFLPGAYSYNLATGIFTGNPPGYIFLNKIEIWPNVKSIDLALILRQESLDPRLRDIYNQAFRTVSIDRATPTGVYYYHPLTPSDSSAFDGIALDAAAYDFIDGELQLKTDRSFSPYYEDNGNLTKKKI